jgi:hypothetical protein
MRKKGSEERGEKAPAAALGQPFNTNPNPIFFEVALSSASLHLIYQRDH